MAGQKCLVVLVVLGYLSSVDSGLVTKCSSEDSSCALKSAKAFLPQFVAGIPDLDVKPLEPVTFKKVDASTNNLKLILSDVTITGLQKCNMKKVVRDKAKNKMFLKLLCSCQLEGQYEMDGQLLILPIKGKGPLHVTLRKAEFNLDLDMGEKKEGDVTFWDVKDWKYTFHLKDKSTVIFENLFDGNEILAQAARSVIEESGNDIVLEVGPPVFKSVIQEIVNDVNAFFHKTPAHELSLD